MFETLIAFLGGTAFRLIFGQAMDIINKVQNHKQELALLKAQDAVEAARALRQQEQLRLAHDLGLKEIQVKGDIEIQKKELDAFAEAVKAAAQKTGVWWVDAWNGSIRPAGATIALGMWVYWMMTATGMTEFDKAIISSFLGVFLGDRIHVKGRI